MTKDSPRFARRTGALVLTAATIVGLTFAVSAPAQASSWQQYPGAKPKWAVAANNSGTPATDTTIEGEVYLPLRNQAAAEALATAVSTPGTRQFRHPLSANAWIAQFAPTQSDLNALVKYVKSEGGTIVAVPKSREFVDFRISAADANAAFNTQLKTYRYQGHNLIAPSTAPSLPGAIAPLASGISIDQSKLLTHPGYVRTDGTTTTGGNTNTPNATSPVLDAPCSTYADQYKATVPPENGTTKVPTGLCGYKPAQLRAGYGLNGLAAKGINGAGQTVAIIDAYGSPTIQQDVNTFSAAAGEPLLRPGQFKQIVQPNFADETACVGPADWQTEETLDVESVHGLAPGANILYLGGYNCGGGLDIATSTVIDNNLSNIISNSYGYGFDATLDEIQLEHNQFVQAAGEGIGEYFSTGDSGDNSSPTETPQPSFPSTDPFVTGVGGTTMGIGQTGNLVFETGWGSLRDQIVKSTTGTLSYVEPLPGTNFGGGSGGGTSTAFTEPAYQKGIVPTSLSNGGRVTPDISGDADPITGFQIGFRPITDNATLATGPYVNQTYGGTSLATPLVAAQIAIIQQATHSAIGFANPTLYGLDRILPSTFRDVKPAPNLQLTYTSTSTGLTWLVSTDHDTSLKTTNGYDNVTGMGDLTYQLLTLLAAGRH
jgi:subtilase family serine protease